LELDERKKKERKRWSEDEEGRGGVVKAERW
jgi:hypothetical protein